MNITDAQNKINLIKDNIGKVIIGRKDTVELVIACLISGGHILLEDVPGTGKTTLAKSLAVSVDSKFSRIQFTPDLLPADIVGINIYSRNEDKFNYVEGPIMTNILLADEINRATPRTQSALLEAMQEKQVTVDGTTRKLSEPFLVIATQNPVETTGTFPLPEAQLDRFMMMLSLGDLNVEEETAMLERFEKREPLNEISSVVTGDDILELRKLADDVFVHRDLLKYIAEINEITRKDASAILGVSPRGGIALLKAAKALALMRGRDYVLPDDIKFLAPSVLSHRIIFVNRKDKKSKDEFVKTLVESVTVPAEEFNVR